jgi:hypothetical protein
LQSQCVEDGFGIDQILSNQNLASYQRRDFLTLHTCAQSLIPIDVMTVGWSISAFHASQAASTIAV